MESEEKRNVDYDLSIFKDDADLPHCSGPDCLECPSLIRLSVALKYYELLSRENEKETFVAFVADIYYGYLDDSNHVMLEHSDNLQKISEHLCETRCNIAKCQITARHFAESRSKIDSDQKARFYFSVFDSLHFWMCHSFDAGYRLKEQERGDGD